MFGLPLAGRSIQAISIIPGALNGLGETVCVTPGMAVRPAGMERKLLDLLSEADMKMLTNKAGNRRAVR